MSTTATDLMRESRHATTPVETLRLGYVMSRFPKLTETFVLFEMRELERLGHHIEIFPLQREHTPVMHDDARSFVNRAHFSPWISGPILWALLSTCARQPFSVFSTFARLLIHNLGSARLLSGAIAFFPKAVWIAQEARRRNLQAIHAHFASHPAAVAWVVHRLTGIPYSFTAHGSDLHRTQAMLPQKCEAASAIITISEYNRRLILEHCGPDSDDRLHVVHCGVTDEALLTDRHETAFDRGEAAMKVICVGTLHEVKGQQYLIEAIAALRPQGVKIECCFVGDGPDEQSLRDRAKSLGLQHVIRFAGRRRSDEVRDLMAESDVLVAPSVPTASGRREGIPVVLMEAMAAHLPVVASRLSGIPELVRHEETGLLTECRNPEDIARALQRLYDSAELRRCLAAAGRELVEREFSIPRNTLRLAQIIRSSVPASVAAQGGRS